MAHLLAIHYIHFGFLSRPSILVDGVVNVKSLFQVYTTCFRAFPRSLQTTRSCSLLVGNTLHFFIMASPINLSFLCKVRWTAGTRAECVRPGQLVSARARALTCGSVRRRRSDLRCGVTCETVLHIQRVL
jgi:hypothetical protein